MRYPNPIPFEDFGGHGPLLHFAHANGYPPGSYQPLFEHLNSAYHILAMRMRPLWPQANPQDLDDWKPLAKDLRRFFNQQGAVRLIGAGHSFGATTTLRLALQQPDLFTALVLIDPVIFPPWMIGLWKIVSRLGLQDRINPLINSSLRRRAIFESKNAMFDNYRKKAVFGRIDDHGLMAYVDSLVKPLPKGQVGLTYSPEWEARIYITGILADGEIWRQLPSLKPPVLLIQGADSNTFWSSTARLILRRLPTAQLTTIPDAGHLVALERPMTLGKEIQKFINPLINTKLVKKN
ncbi:alpha/beta fold hydrolase [Chloroflexota bacterium]